MTYELLAESIQHTLQGSELESLRNFVRSEHPADIAAFAETISPDQIWTILNLLPIEQQAEVFGYLETTQQIDLARHATRARLAALVTEMNADERADLFNRLTEDQKNTLLPALAHAEREDLRRLASYEEGTAGSIMTSDYAILPPNISVARALEKLRREAPDKETIYRTYIVDEQRRLLGSVKLQQLIFAELDTNVSDIMEHNTHAVSVDDDQETVAQQVAKYDLVLIPVVDQNDRLVGIITHDDAMDVLQEEATEDFYKVGTIGAMAQNVREASIGLLYRKRVFWLVILVFGNILSGAGIAYFETIIAAHVALVVFLPVLIGSAGNAGSQASTLMVRALATGDVVFKDWGKMLSREIVIALLLGLTMAGAISLIGIYRGGVELAWVVSLTMVAVVLVGSVVGISLPFILSRFDVDPATASGPLITSIADVTGVVIYFAIASALLSSVAP